MDEKKTHRQLLAGQKPSDDAKVKRQLAKLNKAIAEYSQQTGKKSVRIKRRGRSNEYDIEFE
jgi:hypothetical protein